MTFEELKAKCNEKAEHPKHRHIAHVEDALQMQCVSWFREHYPELASLLFHPNNEAFFGHGKSPEQRARAGQRAKDMGVTPGVADLILLYPSGESHGLCIEMKTKVGRQSDTQKDWEQKVVEYGYKYALCRTLAHFKILVKDYTHIEPLDEDMAAARRLFGDKVRVRKQK